MLLSFLCALLGFRFEVDYLVQVLGLRSNMGKFGGQRTPKEENYNFCAFFKVVCLVSSVKQKTINHCQQKKVQFSVLKLSVLGFFCVWPGLVLSFVTFGQPGQGLGSLFRLGGLWFVLGFYKSRIKKALIKAP